MTRVEYARHTFASQAQQLEHHLLLAAAAVLGLLSAMSMVEGLSGSFTSFAGLLVPGG